MTIGTPLREASSEVLEARVRTGISEGAFECQRLQGLAISRVQSIRDADAGFR